MNETANNPEAPKKESWWRRLQHGQAMVEYWPTLPAGVMVMISAAAIVGPIQRAFQTTADSMSGITCEAPPAVGPMETDLDGGHHIEVVSSNYNGSETTVVFRVSSGDSPSISHWVLGIDKETADKILYSSEAYESWGTDPTTGKTGIKFDTGYEGTGGSGGSGGSGKGGPKKARVIHTFSPRMNTYVETRDIVLTLSGYVDFVETVEVTTKAGSDQVSSGYVSIPTTGAISSDSSC
ncbi:MAG: hypothetical protein K8J31_11480 [Anaerolineae bacterium]|nr:hypothetical protein [Anaerolineae bacterium]